jgi:hypothetical protein
MGLLYLPLMTNMQHWWNNDWQYTTKNLTQCYFIHHKAHMNYPGTEPCLCNEKPKINRLSYGISFLIRPCTSVWQHILEKHADFINLFLCCHCRMINSNTMITIYQSDSNINNITVASHVKFCVEIINHVKLKVKLSL